MTRKLASVQRIKAIDPIPGADRIEVATINGWKVVTQKGLYQVGDLVVYCEIDSFIPHTVAPFLTEEGKLPKEYNGVQGERLKTQKLRKQVSEGLLLPMTALISVPAGAALSKTEKEKALNSPEGTDVTEHLGIQLWESPEERESKNGGSMASKTRAFPYFIRKTDQARVQNITTLESYLDTEFEVTVKKDGSSGTAFRIDPASEYYDAAYKMVHGKPSLWQRIKLFFGAKKQPVFGLCSRNCLLTREGESNFHKAMNPVLNALNDCRFDGKSYAIQGEVVAPDIQGNYEKVEGVEYHVFDVFNIDKQQYVTPGVRQEWVGVTGLNHATVVDKGTLRSIIQYKEGDDIVEKLLTYASGEGDNPGVQREGVVFKAMDRDFSFKVVSNEYLLKKG